MMGARGRRGEPLVALATLLCLWVAVRALLWHAVAIHPLVHTAQARVREKRHAPAPRFAPREARRPRDLSGGFAAALARPAIQRLAVAALPSDRSALRLAGTQPRVTAAGQIAWMATMARTPIPEVMLASIAPESLQPAPLAPVERASHTASRWSADGWLLARPGGSVTLARGAAPATYGASQLGAVLRYRLFADSRHRPTAYVRASAALNGSGEREAAAGLAARPLPAVPVTLAAELRVNRQPGRTDVRPAAYAVTEIPPFGLPLGLGGEAYAQAGWVGGDFATGFVDGQLRVDRPAARLGKAALRIGAGVWGGAQKGASRLDVGPALTLGFGIGEHASARLAFDWRVRVAGNAAPGSGPALTLSAGF